MVYSARKWARRVIVVLQIFITTFKWISARYYVAIEEMWLFLRYQVGWRSTCQSVIFVILNTAVVQSKTIHVRCTCHVPFHGSVGSIMDFEVPRKLCGSRISHPTEAAAPRNSSPASPLHKVALRRGYFILKLATPSIHPSVCPLRLTFSAKLSTEQTIN